MEGSTFRAGVAERDITPSAATVMSGFAVRTEPSLGVHDRIYAKALVLGEADARTCICLLLLDVIGVDEDLVTAIRQGVETRMGVSGQCVAVHATHTHGGPATLRQSHLGEVDEAYLEYLVQGAVDACCEAIVSQQACTLALGRAQNAEVAQNRRGEGITDPELSLLRIEREGRCVALLVSYACHPVVVGPQNRLLTRDYPGSLVASLEAAFPEAVVMFATGCAGQINTGHSAKASWSKSENGGRTFGTAEHIGALLARSALEADAARKPLIGLGVHAISVQLELPLAPSPTSPEVLRRNLEHDLETASSESRRLLLAQLAWAASVVPASSIPVELMALRIGELRIACFPGEPFVEYGLRLKTSHSPLISLGYCSGSPGYLPTAAACSAGGYEVEEAYRFYGQAGPFSAEIEELLLKSMSLLLKEVA